MANDGFIKLYRKMLEWEWYDEPVTKCVFLHLLILAQYEDGFYRGVKLSVGDAISTVNEIAMRNNVSVSGVRTALKHLKNTGELTIKNTNKFSVYTLKNYAKYNGIDKQMTNERQTTDKQIANKSQTTNKPSTNHRQTINKPSVIKKSRSQEVKKEKDISMDISKATHGEFQNVMLGGLEHEKLVDSLGDIGAQEYIQRLSAYLAQTGRGYKSHYATILSWWRKDGKPVQQTACCATVHIKPDVTRELPAGITAKELF